MTTYATTAAVACRRMTALDLPGLRTTRNIGVMSMDQCGASREVYESRRGGAFFGPFLRGTPEPGGEESPWPVSERAIRATLHPFQVFDPEEIFRVSRVAGYVSRRILLYATDPGNRA
eukprot:scaffold4342_cov234-Pinguiococcus_pyrenoidosus.AAC.10